MSYKINARACQIIAADTIAGMSTLPEKHFHTSVTSPPYWGLRDYKNDGQLGQEDTPEQYVAAMVGVFSALWRILRDDGTLWLNLGDSYASTPMEGSIVGDLKQKDLVGIPWMVAFALRSAGWYLRQEIIWHKTSCMPESVTDRCTKSHEQIFLLTKQPDYYFDHVAIQELAAYDGRKDEQFKGGLKDAGGYAVGGNANTMATAGHSRWIKNESGERIRNKRSVWSVPPATFKGAHFATFSPRLIKPCILAGTSARGCCAECGYPYERLIDKTDMVRVRDGSNTSGEKPIIKTTGWKKPCDCMTQEVLPCSVFDPFLGSGTTVATAMELGRYGSGCELNPEYAQMARERTSTTSGLPLF